MIKIDAATLLQMINRVKKFASTESEFIINTVHIHALNGHLWAEDCWAILMPCRTTGRETDSVWDHFIKELTKSPTNTCPSRKEEK